RASADLRHKVWLAALAALPLLLIRVQVPAAVSIAVAGGSGAERAVGSVARSIPWALYIWAAGFGLVLVWFAAGLIRLAVLTRRAKLADGVRDSNSIASPLTWGAIR